MSHRGSTFYAYPTKPMPGSPEAVQKALDELRAGQPSSRYKTGKWYGPKSRALDRPTGRDVTNRKARITLPKVGGCS